MHWWNIMYFYKEWCNTIFIHTIMQLKILKYDLSRLSVEPASTKENNCLNAAKACNLNDTCKKYRSAYINPCTSRVSASEVCNKRKCHKALRHFFDKVSKHGHFLQLYTLLFFFLRVWFCGSNHRPNQMSNVKVKALRVVASVTYIPPKAAIHIMYVCILR